MRTLTTILSLAIITIACGIGFGIATRVDEDTIELLSGTAIGILTGAPCAALCTYIIMRNKDSDSWRGGCLVKRHGDQSSVTPPVQYSQSTAMVRR